MSEVEATTAAASFPIPDWLEAWEADVATTTVHVFKKVEANGVRASTSASSCTTSSSWGRPS